ncbi:hypothetical protein LEN26_019060 [Aphanomyces euteiches]|nr:hypothetical protein LEN26_019060 [Aphanomyces euteiches]KAH9117292.1 hypothetical protein AeMF1_008926 [Aphanomyces euteiches]KAH9189444.1 hypothetical protein AeNC1_008586 [Aphanomyces euteiches]
MVSFRLIVAGAVFAQTLLGVSARALDANDSTTNATNSTAATETITFPTTASSIQIQANASIAIIGAGPAGVHYASLLAQKGFSNITILEYSNEIGGKSKTVVDDAGYPHELGTCYTHALYDPIIDLINKYDPTNVLVPFDPMVSGNTLIMSDNTPLYDYPTYAFLLSRNLTGITSITGLQSALQQAFVKYIGLHQSFFGTYSYGLPPQPKDWTQLAGTAAQFIQNNHLQVIQPWFEMLFERQGYGSLASTPAFYLLWWGHPDLVRRYLVASSQGKPWVFMLSNGYQSLWESIAKAHANDFSIQFRTAVTSISQRDTQPQVTVRQWPIGGNPKTDGVVSTFSFDHIVMAVDLSISSPDLSTEKGSPIQITDLDESEKWLFNGYTSAAFVTTKFTSPPLPFEAVVEWWPERGQGAFQGRVQLARNTHMALWNSTAALSAPLNATAAQSRVVYQHYDPASATTSRQTYQATLTSDLASMFPGYDANPTTTFFASYAPRTSTDKLTQNQPWAIWNNQGAHHTTWIGSSVTFESVLDVVTYNQKLIDRVQLV